MKKNKRNKKKLNKKRLFILFAIIFLLVSLNLKKDTNNNEAAEKVAPMVSKK